MGVHRLIVEVPRCCFLPGPEDVALLGKPEAFFDLDLLLAPLPMLVFFHPRPLDSVLHVLSKLLQVLFAYVDIPRALPGSWRVPRDLDQAQLKNILCTRT